MNKLSVKNYVYQEESRTVINIDRYGTETIRIVEKCSTCNGTGYLKCFDYHENGICFQCSGSGFVERIEKEMTPEREAQLKEQADKKFQKKLQKDIAEEQKRIAERFPEGKIWIVRNRNTFDIKDKIKEAGGKFNRIHKWYFIHKVEGFNLQEIAIEEAFEYKWQALIEGGILDIDRPKFVEGEIEEHPSNWIGNIGDKIDMDVIFKTIRFYKVESKFHYGKEYHSIYVFEDDNKNILIWDTTGGYDNDLNIHNDKDIKVNIKATIKVHSKYNDVKQTKLSRCKIKRIQ